MSESPNGWRIFRGTGRPHDDLQRLPAPPLWRDFAVWRGEQGLDFEYPENVVNVVNAALFLRRPVLVEGDPGSGKSSLARAIAQELKLGEVLIWPINSKSTIQDGEYSYDAIGRLQDAQRRRDANEPILPSDEQLQAFLQLGPLGTAMGGHPLPSTRPRVLLIDEIDKSDLDLPNDLLHVFEDGQFVIRELERLGPVAAAAQIRAVDGSLVDVPFGRVACRVFPIVIVTSNRERELPVAFMRRCLRLTIENPDRTRLTRIVRRHLKDADATAVESLLTEFLERRDGEGRKLATDQLLNAIFVITRGGIPPGEERDALVDELMRDLGRG